MLILRHVTSKPLASQKLKSKKMSALDRKKVQLKSILNEINILLVDVVDASPNMQIDLIEEKQNEALLLGVDIAMTQIMSTSNSD